MRFCFGVVAETVVAEHQIVVRLQILGIDAERSFKFLHRIRIFLLQKINPAEFVTHDAIERILLQYALQFGDGFVVLAFFFEVARIKIICACQIWLQGQSFVQRLERARGVALLRAHSSDIYPAIEIIWIGFRRCDERGFGALKIILQK